ncbi:MAG: hypothetical protein ACD_20C00373G0001 [uncultured bacterium]|nr:MAG: hypothetical protein ACD_20C00373G0001 [uncultured bacterium]
MNSINFLNQQQYGLNSLPGLNSHIFPASFSSNSVFGMINPVGFGNTGLFGSSFSSWDFMNSLSCMRMPLPMSSPTLGMNNTGFWNGFQNMAASAWRNVKHGFSSVVSYAKSHLGMRNDGRFSQGRNEAWCADFVNYTFEGKLGHTPWGYRDKKGSYKASVSEIKSWGQNNGRYQTIEQAAANGFRDIKPGDVFIQKRLGSSHTGIVSKVDPDGTIHTVEGNASNKVMARVYKPGSKGFNKIDGFVKVSDYAESRVA